jgi:hypothetical protein
MEDGAQAGDGSGRADTVLEADQVRGCCPRNIFENMHARR